MAKRLLFLGFIFAISAVAHSAPGVWEQMQSGSVNATRGIIKSVDLIGDEVYFKAESRNPFGDPVTRSEHLCGYNDGMGEARNADPIRAVSLKSKIDLLNEAQRTGKEIEFGTNGIWKSCVSFLRLGQI